MYMFFQPYNQKKRILCRRLAEHTFLWNLNITEPAIQVLEYHVQHKSELWSSGP